MSTDKNVQTVKDFFAAMGNYNELRSVGVGLRKILNGSFRARAGRWQEPTAATRNWRLC